MEQLCDLRHACVPKLLDVYRDLLGQCTEQVGIAQPQALVGRDVGVDEVTPGVGHRGANLVTGAMIEGRSNTGHAASWR